MYDQGDDGHAQQRWKDHTVEPAEHENRDHDWDDTASDVNRDRSVPGPVTDGDAVSHTEVTHHRLGLGNAARNLTDWNIDITSDQACEQRHESELRRQAQGLENSADHSDPN